MPAGSVFFLSDYGRRDEFVGVVHAVLVRHAPGCTVVDLTHEVPPFDVRAGAGTLARCVPHLGPGVVLAVVDPGVGGDRRGVVLDAGPDAPVGPRYFVGPDNGLLVPATDVAGGTAAAYALSGSREGAATFDGRDLFAPVAAALLWGESPAALGEPFDPASLVRLAPPVVETDRLSDGRSQLRSEVTAVDRFGNVQLAAAGDSVPADVPMVLVSVDRGGGEAPDSASAQLARCVRTFADLAPDEFGLLVDGAGQLAVVAREDSASARLGARAGMLVDLLW